MPMGEDFDSGYGFCTAGYFPVGQGGTLLICSSWQRQILSALSTIYTLISTDTAPSTIKYCWDNKGHCMPAL